MRLADGALDEEEKAALLETLNQFSNQDFELGGVLKPSTLPLCHQPPSLQFNARAYSFTGTFNYGQRKDCEKAVVDRGGARVSLTRKTNVLVIGAYVTDSWKHSSFGNKVLQASTWREEGRPIGIVSSSTGGSSCERMRL